MNKAEELIACLEGEIAKRDAELCERTEEVEHALADLNNALAELAAIKAQEPVAARVRFRHPQKTMPDWSVWQQTKVKPNAPAWTIDGAGYEVEYQPLYAAPVSEAKAQGVVMPERDAVIRKAVGMCNRIPGSTTWNAAEYAYDELAARLNAAPVQQVSVPDAAFRNVDQALDLIVGIRHGKNVTQNELWQACELLDAALAAHRAAPAPGGE